MTLDHVTQVRLTPLQHAYVRAVARQQEVTGSQAIRAAVEADMQRAAALDPALAERLAIVLEHGLEDDVDVHALAAELVSVGWAPPAEVDE